MKNLFLAAILLLNALPVAGVLFWGWQSFDLIFLYWLENVIIGVFMILRILVRPYQHPLDMINPLFFAPFFIVHYGMFCGGHGMFIFSLFAEGRFEDSGGFLMAYENIPLVLEQQAFLLYAALALVLLQLMDWGRDIAERGLGADGLKDLTAAPYRRIVVLHVAILASGFLLAALNEPVAGLVTLVIVKTLFDVYHWRKDEAAAAELTEEFVLTPEKLAELDEKLPAPFVEVNGERIDYETFADLKQSKHWRMMMSVMRMVGGKEVKALNAYIDRRIEMEQNEKHPQSIQ
jgi:hypothetical protein